MIVCCASSASSSSGPLGEPEPARCPLPTRSSRLPTIRRNCDFSSAPANTAATRRAARQGTGLSQRGHVLCHFVGKLRPLSLQCRATQLEVTHILALTLTQQARRAVLAHWGASRASENIQQRQVVHSKAELQPDSQAATVEVC